MYILGFCLINRTSIPLAWYICVTFTRNMSVLQQVRCDIDLALNVPRKRSIDSLVG